MDNKQQQEQLHSTIWKIADDLRGAIGCWEFKAYILGTLFYRFISENLTEYINSKQREIDPNFNYVDFSDEEALNAKGALVQEKGFFIKPSELFCNVCKRCEEDEDLNVTLSEIFRNIEQSAQGTPAEYKIKGLFNDFNVNNTQLSPEVKNRNKLISKVLLSISKMELGKAFYANKIDAFGDAYEFLMTMYASGAGKSGGEFFTPQEVSEVLARIVASDGHEINSCYDPACGSGSLLLKFKKIVGINNPYLRYFGQEKNPTTYNLCRINMFLHDINYDKFDIEQGDTLTDPKHIHLGPFDAIVSNPPYSILWEGDTNPLLINDERFSPAGVLAPNKNADLAFIMHILYSLAQNGTAAIVEFPGVLYRGGKEKTIRTYLIENNFIDSIIQLPSNLFFGVGIATCIIVLRKSAKQDQNILFIDASKLFVKSGNKNKLTQENMDTIVNAFKERKDQQYFTKLVSNQDVLSNDGSLSVSSYVEQEDTREKIDIELVERALADVTTKGSELRAKINEIIKGL